MSGFSGGLAEFLHGLAASEDLDVDWRQIVDRAAERYRSHFLELAAKVPDFAIWATLSEDAATRALVRASNAELAQALSQNRDALARIEALVSLTVGPGATPGLLAVMERANRAVLADEIITAGDDVSGPGITSPTIGRVFINPRFRAAEVDERARPADARWWESERSRDDFDDMLAGYVLAPDATRLPMLLLGDPGAGKSMLTKVLAARLPGAGYTVVRVPLRRVTASAPIVHQVQEALDESTNRRVTWGQLSDQSLGTIPVVLLDGLDELLQASDSDRSGYLQDAMDFQRREAEQDRPVVVIVTSRIVVAERVAIPRGTTVVKLDPFTDEDITDWLSRWSEANAAAIRENTLRALTPGAALRHGDLARQPLLLLMLALYTADPALPALDAGMPTTTLYRRLLDEFTRREARKSAGRDARDDELDQHARDHLDRLALAALAMFNRGRQDIGEDEIGADLKAIDERLMSRARQDEAGQAVIGGFFFVHAAEARPLGAGASPGRTRRSYEFLHPTFGEYLVADYIMAELADVAGKASAGRRGLAAPEDDLLFALLSHQPLAARQSTLTFAQEIRDGLPPAQQRQVLGVLDVLVDSYRDRHGSDRYSSYHPTPPDTVRRLACYSANLVSLRVSLDPGESGVPLANLTREPGDGLAQWQQMVTLWKAGLDADGMQATLFALALVAGGPPRIRWKPETMWASGPEAPFYDILLARLLGDRDLEQRIRYGAAIWDDSYYQLPDDHSSWIHEFTSMLIPALAGKETTALGHRPPPDISAQDARVAATLICNYLDSADARDPRTEDLIRTLFSLPPGFDLNPFALARAVIRNPHLLEEIEQLRDPRTYGLAYEAILAIGSPDLLMRLGGEGPAARPRIPEETREAVLDLLDIGGRGTWHLGESPAAEDR